MKILGAKCAVELSMTKCKTRKERTSVYYLNFKHQLLVNNELGMVIMPAIPALRRLRQEDHQFKASLDYETISKKQKTKITEYLH